MINHLFSQPIWKTKLNLDTKVRDDLLQQIQLNYQQFSNYKHPNWNCNVHSTCAENNNVDYTHFIEYIVREYTEFSILRSIKLHQYNITGPWYNYYLRSSNQEMHTHAGNSKMYSGVYFLRLNDDHPKITFYNNSGSYLYYEAQQELANLYDRNNTDHSNIFVSHILDVKEDDFILFPAYLGHGVYIQNTDEPRITISFNVVYDKQH